MLMFVCLRETYEIALLNKKAKRLRKETNNPDLRSARDLGLPPKELLKQAALRPMKLLIFSPFVLALSVYIAFVYGILYLLFTTITSVCTETYGFSQGLSGLAYLGIGIGMMLGLGIVGGSSDLLLKKLAAAKKGVIKPEYRLPPMIVAGLILPIGLFLYGWTAQYSIPWMVRIIGTGFVGVGLIGSFVSAASAYTETVSNNRTRSPARHISSMRSEFTQSQQSRQTPVLRSLFGALVPLAGPSMYEALGLG
jgi:hypothetical protein